MKKITFVCTGNTCRSAMCEIMLKKLLRNEEIKGIRVSSCGLSVCESAINPLAAAALKKLGFRVGKFMPKQAVSTEISKQNAVICMTAAHMQRFLDFKNVYTFDMLTGCGEIADPYGKGEDAYNETAACLLAVCKALLTLLLEEKL